MDDWWWMILSLKNRAAVAFAMFFVLFQNFVIIMWLSIYPNPGSWPLLVGENRSTCSSTSNNFEYPNISYIHTNHDPLENLLRQRCYLWIFRSDARTKVPATSTRSWQWGLLMGIQGPKDSSSDGKCLYETRDDLMRGLMVGYSCHVSWLWVLTQDQFFLWYWDTVNSHVV